MELVITFINSILAKALNHRQFKEFLFEMESEYADLLHNKATYMPIPFPVGLYPRALVITRRNRQILALSPVDPRAWGPGIGIVGGEGS
ncbi:hypothetical protein TNCV_3395221 [Trichonephila clavipes]|nr:hypothetical protein TNCV_3395221 [Trichonephila clavipes]